MNTPPSNGQLVRVVPGTPEDVAALAPVVGAGQRFAGETLVGVYFVLARDVAQSVGAAPRYLFCQVGNQWKVIFDGGAAFYLGGTLGGKYLDYLLHRPNEAISALDLEQAIQPEKAKARPKTSIQKTLDEPAMRAKLQQLDELRSEREEAQAAGDEGRVSRLDREIQKGEAELEGVQPGDAGARARSNVSQAVGAVRRRLERGSRKQKAFGEHLREFLSLGYECMYIQAPGRIWR